MTFSTKDIKHIAQLARLTLTDKEIIKYRREISGIVGYVAKLAEINISKEEATISLNEDSNLLRIDSSSNWDELEKKIVLDNIPKRKNNLVSVPRIFEL